MKVVKELMAAARRGEQLDLPSFLGSGGAGYSPCACVADCDRILQGCTCSACMVGLGVLWSQ